MAVNPFNSLGSAVFGVSSSPSSLGMSIRSDSPFKPGVVSGPVGFKSSPSVNVAPKSNLPLSPVYNLAQTSIAGNLVKATDISYTKSLYGGNLPASVNTNTGLNVAWRDEGPTVRMDDVGGDQVTTNDQIYPNLGGYYETSFPYGSYYGSTFIGGDDDYSGVAFFPFEWIESMNDNGYDFYDPFYDMERYIVPELQYDQVPYGI